MIEILEFIFQDFWHWLGTFLLIFIIPVPFVEDRSIIKITRNETKRDTKDNVQ